MTGYLWLPEQIRILMGIYILILFLICCYICVNGYMYYGKKKYGVYMGIPIIFDVLFLQMGIRSLNGVPQSWCGELLGNLPYFVLLVVTALITVGTIVTIVQMLRFGRQIPTPNSIKQSLDAMQDGVCFFSDAGMPLLVNTQMEWLYDKLVGGRILNVWEFMDTIKHGKCVAGVSTIPGNSGIMVLLPDQTAWNFKLSKLQGGEARELIAYDVTEEYHLNMEHKLRNEQLLRIGKRLRQLNEEIMVYTREKEIFAAKERIHNDFGNALLMLCAYIEMPVEKRNRKALIAAWKYYLMMFEAEPGTDIREDMEHLLYDAEAMGVSVSINTDFPQEDEIRRVLLLGLRQTISNTAKHTDEKKLRVVIDYHESYIEVEYENEEANVKKEVQESGGLRLLREAVEKNGGMMKVISNPRFAVRIRLERENHEENKSVDCR